MTAAPSAVTLPLVRLVICPSGTVAPWPTVRPIPSRLVSLSMRSVPSWTFRLLKELGADHALVAVSHECLAGILVQQGKPRDAMAHLEVAELIRSKPGSDPAGLRFPYRWMGLAQSGMGDGRKAVSYLERALKLAPDDPVFAADVRFDLARVTRGTRGELQRAREYAVKARDEYRSIGIEHDAARVDQWLAANGG